MQNCLELQNFSFENSKDFKIFCNVLEKTEDKTDLEMKFINLALKQLNFFNEITGDLQNGGE